MGTTTGMAYLDVDYSGTIVVTTRSDLGWTLTEEVSHRTRRTSMLTPAVDQTFTEDVASTLDELGWRPIDAVPAEVPSNFRIART